MRNFFVGLDLGERQDPSAIAVVEKIERARPYGPPEFEELRVRQLARAPLGTPYPMLVAGVREGLRSSELRDQCTLVVDSTGVGIPVIEMLRGAKMGCEVLAVTITGGERATQHGQNWNVPKKDLMSGVQLLLDEGRLRIAKDLPEAGWLVKELVDVRVRQKASGRVRMGADGYGEHDDLVIALALAVWRARRRY
jgi:hypothetical protein